MRLSAISTAFALAFSAPAVANDQLAASIGVEPGVYTTTELVQIMAARDDDSRHLLKVLTDQDGGAVVSTQSIFSSGTDQLARSIGLDPDAHSLNELVRIKAEREQDPD